MTFSKKDQLNIRENALSWISVLASFKQYRLYHFKAILKDAPSNQYGKKILRLEDDF